MKDDCIFQDTCVVWCSVRELIIAKKSLIANKSLLAFHQMKGSFTFQPAGREPQF
mgnify:CR=1 FL=1